ncbi:hypothetical protein FAGAP_7021 [Fusarium agapanthi]|uniref:Uncharacterized protein n=1 Tax=Fusarium agapanthi TaxID=1803897 RepID=A0A9P5B977_9HYPO|nr:hypothetical protein FAGAP_7021 [Fusarium agapanthi]
MEYIRARFQAWMSLERQAIPGTVIEAENNSVFEESMTVIKATLPDKNEASKVPAYLAMICWFTQERTRLEDIYKDIHGSQARLELDKLEAKMVKLSKRLRIIRLTFGWTNRCRMRSNRNTREEFEFDIAPLISGQPHPELHRSMDGLDSRVNFVQSSGVMKRWPEADLARIRRVDEEIMDYFGVELGRGGDGCPYFPHPESFPPNWNWNIAFLLTTDRLHRMTVACNRYWATYDTPDTIFLECVFQVCVARSVLDPKDTDFKQKRQLKEKYQSILGLPLSIAYHDGLTFVLGHREHGKGMFSGWPVNPTSIKQRLNGDDENNMLIEPRTENYLKQDYPESVYPQLKQIIMDVDLPKEVYDKNFKHRSLPKQDLQDIMWNGEEVEDDLLKETPGLFDSGLAWPVEKDLEPEGYGILAGNPHTEAKTSRKRIPESTGLSEKALGKMPVRTRSLSSQAESVTEQQRMDDMAQKYSEIIERLRQRGIDPADDLGLGSLLENLKDAKDRGDEQAFLAVLAVLYGELD